MDKKSLQKLLVGHYIETIPTNCKKKVIYVMQGDGFWQVRKNNIGTFYIHMLNVNVPGLTSSLQEGWELNVPKIPIDLWNITLSFFKDVQKAHDTEAYLQFFYDIEKKEYILYCPEQEVSKASVSYKTNPLFETSRYIYVLEIHSHGTMGAFFSGTDNADEKSDRFFGVIGKINSSPEFKFRLMIGGIEVEVDLKDLFEIEDVKYPSWWLDNIKEKKFEFKGKSINKFDDEAYEFEQTEFEEFFKNRRRGYGTFEELDFE